MAKTVKANYSKNKYGIGQFILTIVLVLLTVFFAAPVLLVFIAAFTDEVYITQHGFSFLPKAWSLNGFNSVLRYGTQLLRSYGVTIGVTVVGTLLGLLIMSMYAYSISRRDFRLSKFLSIYLLIPMLFNGGQLSGYIVFTGYYHLKDSLLLLILPLCVTTMNVIILRTYIANSIPYELMEAATIDGAGDYRRRRLRRLHVHGRLEHQDEVDAPTGAVGLEHGRVRGEQLDLRLCLRRHELLVLPLEDRHGHLAPRERGQSVFRRHRR